MDPDEALRQLRADVATLSVAVGEDSPLWAIVEHFSALDQWLSRGGFLPRPWQAKTDPPRRYTCTHDAVVMGRCDTCGEYPHGHYEPLGGPVPGVNDSHLPDDLWKDNA